MKTKNINIRLSEDELKMLKRQARKSGLCVSAYIRAIIYGKDIPSWDEQGREGIVINTNEDMPIGKHYLIHNHDDIERKG